MMIIGRDSGPPDVDMRQKNSDLGRGGEVRCEHRCECDLSAEGANGFRCPVSGRAAFLLGIRSCE
jgi:hypothetical protein